MGTERKVSQKIPKNKKIKDFIPDWFLILFLIIIYYVNSVNQVESGPSTRTDVTWARSAIWVLFAAILSHSLQVAESTRQFQLWQMCI